MQRDGNGAGRGAAWRRVRSAKVAVTVASLLGLATFVGVTAAQNGDTGPVAAATEAHDPVIRGTEWPDPAAGAAPDRGGVDRSPSGVPADSGSDPFAPDAAGQPPVGGSGAS